MSRRMVMAVLTGMTALAGCAPTNERPSRFEFSGTTRMPRVLTTTGVNAAARSGLRSGERISSSVTRVAHGLGQTVVEVVAETDNNSRAYVVDEDGNISETQLFWAQERAAQIQRFGKLTPVLFEKQLNMASTETITVDITVLTDLPEPQLPFDGQDQKVAIAEFE